MISPQTIQQIVSRIDIIDVLGDFIKLKKRGVNYIGLCPFHNERTPSFTASPSKEIYKCFGCGKSGNTISFLMEHEKYSYVEALRWLAKKYNIVIEESEVSAEVAQQRLLSESLFIINQFAKDYFVRTLHETTEGQTIGLSYLKERGFNLPIIQKFEIGYCLNTLDAFAQEAKQKQYNTAYLLKTGLVAERNGTIADNYRDRIIFPIHNHTGRIIGFGARLIQKNDRAPKYINTPENELYNKSKVLYGMYFARQAIDKQNECLLVEGYTDVLSLHQAGIENVVASGGTSLTQDQLRLIKKYTSNLTIIYDGDSAGIKAALRGLDMALAEGLYVKLVLIPDNEDPDSYVQKLGSTAFQTFIEKEKKDFILFQLEVMLKQAGSDTQKRSETVNQIAETLSHLNKVEDFTRQQDYIKTCAALLRIDEEGLTHLVNKYKRDRLTKQEKTSLQFPVAAEEDVEANTLNLLLGDEAQERGIIRCLLEYGLNNWTTEKTVADYIFEELEHFHIENPLLEKISNIYQKLYKEGLQPNVKMFSYYPEKDISDEIIAIMASPYELSENWDRIMEGANINNRDVSVEDVTLSMSYFKLHKLKKMLQQNQQDMQQAVDAETLNRCLSIHKTLKDIEQEITKLLGTVISK